MKAGRNGIDYAKENQCNKPLMKTFIGDFVSKLFWTILIVAALGSFLILALQRRILFPTHVVPTISRDRPIPHGVEQIVLGTPDQPVEAWLLRAESNLAAAKKKIVLFFHGNAEIIDDLPIQLNRYVRAGINVALLEYRGYGRSRGSPSQTRLVSDAVQLRRVLIQRYGYAPDSFIYHGRSLGGGVASGLAERHAPRGLILESTFSSIRAMASRMLIPGILVLDPFDSARIIETLECPILILHGRFDDVVPVDHSEQLAKASPRAERHLFDASHNDLSSHSDAYWGHILRFISEENNDN